MMRVHVRENLGDPGEPVVTQVGHLSCLATPFSHGGGGGRVGISNQKTSFSPLKSSGRP